MGLARSIEDMRVLSDVGRDLNAAHSNLVNLGKRFLEDARALVDSDPGSAKIYLDKSERLLNWAKTTHAMNMEILDMAEATGVVAKIEVATRKL